MKKFLKMAVICAALLPLAMFFAACGDKGSDPTPPANNKSDYDMSNAKWSYSAPFVYDGQTKSVYVTGLPEGVTVKQYQNASAVDAGTYVAHVELNYDAENYNAPSVPDKTWEISKAEISGVTLTGRTFEYDGFERRLVISGEVPEGAEITYTYNGEKVQSVNEVGEYEVVCKITCANYNDLTLKASLIITPTEETLLSVATANGVYFQNSLDANSLYVYNGDELQKLSEDAPACLLESGDKLYYFNSSSLICMQNQENPTVLYSIDGDSLATDGTYLYFAVNDLSLDADKNGIFRVKIDGTSENAEKLVGDRAQYLTYLGGYIYYSNVGNGGKLYRISVSGDDHSSELLWQQKVSYLTCDAENLYFNSNILVSNSIYKFNVAENNFVQLSTNGGKYLSVFDGYVYFVSSEIMASNPFGNTIYRVSTAFTENKNEDGESVISAESNDGFGSLTVYDGSLYYYRSEDKHFHKYDLTLSTETDLMEDFSV